MLPPAAAIERLCRKVRHQARQQMHRTLIEGLTFHQRSQLEALLEPEPEARLSGLAWLLQAPHAGQRCSDACGARPIGARPRPEPSRGTQPSNPPKPSSSACARRQSDYGAALGRNGARAPSGHAHRRRARAWWDSDR